MKHIPSEYKSYHQYKMCKGTACITEKYHVITAAVTANVVEYQVGLLLIHANSEIMRRWLWKDVLNNID